MSKQAAFECDYVDLRFVKSRKVAQIVVELPIEQAAAFVAWFGAPNPATGTPVAIARMDQKAVSEAPKPEKDHRKWEVLRFSQQAAIRCGELEFQLWLSAREESQPGEDTADVVRRLCKVASRKDLDTNEKATIEWFKLDADYRAEREHAGRNVR